MMSFKLAFIAIVLAVTFGYPVDETEPAAPEISLPRVPDISVPNKIRIPLEEYGGISIERSRRNTNENNEDKAKDGSVVNVKIEVPAPEGGPKPEIPNAPALPALPIFQGFPGVPALPVVPSVTGSPAISIPVFPALPGVPAFPGLPGVPGIPGIPGIPGGPGLPGVPGLPIPGLNP